VNIIRSGLIMFAVFASNTSWLVSYVFVESVYGKQTCWIILTVLKKDLMFLTCGMPCLITNKTRFFSTCVMVINFAYDF